VTEDRAWHIREAEKFRTQHREAYAALGSLSTDAHAGRLTSVERLTTVWKVDYTGQAAIYHAAMAATLPEVRYAVRHAVITEHLPDPRPDESYTVEDSDGDLWAWVTGYGWTPVRVRGDWYTAPSTSRSGFPKFKDWKKLIR
jgi:hypothetical protein